jgi:hypothetical protein
VQVVAVGEPLAASELNRSGIDGGSELTRG